MIVIQLGHTWSNSNTTAVIPAPTQFTANPHIICILVVALSPNEQRDVEEPTTESCIKTITYRKYSVYLLTQNHMNLSGFHPLPPFL